LWWVHAIYAVAQHFTAETAATCPGFRSNREQISLCTDIALPHFPLLYYFVANDQTVAVAMSTTHDAACEIRRSGAQLPSMLRRFVLACRHRNKGGSTVDLALRLNVLAVCAVFVFVGAILLGAF
jgi:hypothetical protein